MDKKRENEKMSDIDSECDAKVAYSIEQKLNKLILDLIWQACGEDEDGQIDNCAISVYEEACRHLYNLDLIDKKNDRIYFLKKTDKRIMSGEI